VAVLNTSQSEVDQLKKDLRELEQAMALEIERKERVNSELSSQISDLMKESGAEGCQGPAGGRERGCPEEVCGAEGGRTKIIAGVGARVRADKSSLFEAD
jgi:hypothetical protein